jgi:thiol-disulfide isomerase/thioredoxin
MNFRKIFSLCLAAMLILSVPASLAEATAAPEATQEAYENPFLLMEIKDINGEPFDVSIFSGKPFMINVWASWCGPCVSEMPDLDTLSKEYGDRITMLGLMRDAVAADTKGELMLNQSEIDDARVLYEKLGISYPSLIPNALMMSLMYQVQMQYFPSTLFFNGEGYLVDMQVGSKSKEDWALAIDKVLAGIQEEKAK